MLAAMIGCLNWLVKILKGMVSTSTTSSALQDGRDVGIGWSDVDDLTNAVYEPRFERYVLNSSSLQTVDNLDGFLSGRNAGSDTQGGFHHH